MAHSIKTISIIGSGNVASHLALALHQSGFRILEIYSRSLENATVLAKKTGAEPTNRIEALSNQADLFIFSLSDDAYPEILKTFPHANALIVHTAGSLSIDILKTTSDRHGVLYPFQTFSKEKEISFNSIPILYCGSSESVNEQLKALATQLSRNVRFADDTQRKQLHIAAVFACNFVNHLYAIAKEITDANDLDFSLLYPLIQETANKAQSGDPIAMQTGPAVRGDQSIIDNHLTLLQATPDIQNLYKTLSKRILDTQSDLK